MTAREPPVFTSDFRQTLRELIRWRRDVRSFRRDPLPDGLLDRLLADASCAPSVGLSQPWRFVLVNDPARRAAVLENFSGANAHALAGYEGERARLYASLKLSGLREAPVHLAVFADIATTKGDGLGRNTMPETIAYSVVAAIQTFWLLARAEGVGVGWVSILDPAQVTADLDVPGDWRLVAYLCAGYPSAETMTPELETAGWEKRSSPASFTLLR